jgi:ElaB/YqjD/DUF883 family membrane-anchored ribosome-binding protein
MLPSTLEATRRQNHAVRDKAVDAVRHVAHASHEARLLKTIAADAVDDGVYAAKRVIKTARRWTRTIADLRDEAAFRIKREPFKFVGLALGMGIQLGLILGWVSRRATRCTSHDSTPRG